MKKTKNRFAIAASCSDSSINSYYAGQHEIDSGLYNYFIQQFFGINGPDSHKVVYVKDLDLTRDCKLYCLRFSFNDEVDSNDDVAVSIGTINKKVVKRKPFTDIGGRYSLQVIKGIVHLYGVHRLEFSKAVDYDGTTTVFAAYTKNGITPVYYGDLTSQFPYIGIPK